MAGIVIQDRCHEVRSSLTFFLHGQMDGSLIGGRKTITVIPFRIGTMICWAIRGDTIIPFNSNNVIVVRIQANDNIMGNCKRTGPVNGHIRIIRAASFDNRW